MPYRRPCLQSERKTNECPRRIGFLVCRIKPPVLVCQKRRFRPTNPQPFFPAVAAGGGRRAGRLARHLARQAGRNHRTRPIFTQPVPRQPGRLRARFSRRLPRAGSPPPARIRRHERRRAAFHTDAADAQRKPRHPHPSRRRCSNATLPNQRRTSNCGTKPSSTASAVIRTAMPFWVGKARLRNKTFSAGRVRRFKHNRLPAGSGISRRMADTF